MKLFIVGLALQLSVCQLNDGSNLTVTDSGVSSNIRDRIQAFASRRQQKMAKRAQEKIEKKLKRLAMKNVKLSKEQKKVHLKSGVHTIIVSYSNNIYHKN
jgi:uncharacterized membrane protein (DUF106 family)